jgi:DNA-binding transcriptional regulator GbsR (MarR family)
VIKSTTIRSSRLQPAERQLSAAISGFIEGMGLYFEDFGVPRIAGRLLGLLLVTNRPLSLEEVATTLGVSRASVSTNARLILATGLVERVSLPATGAITTRSPRGPGRP